jgi:2,3-bisphosphoglycerate-dependent phosphoglycerate mutase
MAKLILVRHGESLWNQQNRFTGWVDVDLSEKGVQEAQEAGDILKKQDISFSWTYTSVLKRAIKTHWIILNQLDQLWLPVTRSWRLNERHYGSLQGLNKEETMVKHGAEQVKIWRRSFDTPPPQLEETDPHYPLYDKRYQNLEKDLLPKGESLKMTLDRITPFWTENLLPRIQHNENLLVVAHGNSLRALIQMLENYSPEELLELNIPTGVPLEYDLSWVKNVDQNLAIPHAKQDAPQNSEGHLVIVRKNYLR